MEDDLQPVLVLAFYCIRNYHSYGFFDSILNVSAIVLANLCVSYIMTSQNEEAEELMRKIEKVRIYILFYICRTKCLKFMIVL